MKNLLVIIIFLITLPLVSYPQEYEYVPFPTSGAIWSEIYHPPLDMWGNFPPPILERFALSGEDTIINTLTYKKLYIFYDTVFNPSHATCIGGIREDEQRRIYYAGEEIHELKPSYHTSNELLLYNFSLNIGDTLRNANITFVDEAFYVVSDIDTVLIGNTLRKMYCFCNTGEDCSNYCAKWIEGIGFLKGLLFTSGDLPTNGLNNNLICFKQNNEILYFNDNYSDCMPLISSITPPERILNAVRVMPNPAKFNVIQFEMSDIEIENIIIFNVNGVIIDEIPVNEQTNTIQKTHSYPPGIYFFSATSKQAQKYTGKFIVQ